MPCFKSTERAILSSIAVPIRCNNFSLLVLQLHPNYTDPLSGLPSASNCPGLHGSAYLRGSALTGGTGRHSSSKWWGGEGYGGSYGLENLETELPTECHGPTRTLGGPVCDVCPLICLASSLIPTTALQSSSCFLSLLKNSFSFFYRLHRQTFLALLWISPLPLFFFFFYGKAKLF